MQKKEIIQKTVLYVQETLANDSSGHDWWHIYRVWQNALHIGETENVDMYIVELGALLHDIADWKFNNSDFTIGEKVTRTWLGSLHVDEKDIDAVCHIVANVSFKGAHVENKMKSKEGLVVQDADRLDAIGAIGIGRVFAYGGHTGRMMYDPTTKPVLHDTFEEYSKTQSTTINHFYEKLLLLKDMLNTESAKKIAEKRHVFMEKFLEEFYAEWEGKA